MNPEILQQLYLLDMRNACAMMDAINCWAERDAANGGWLCDYASLTRAEQQKFDDARAKLFALPEIK